jgi:hypothetical protein
MEGSSHIIPQKIIGADTIPGNTPSNNPNLLGTERMAALNLPPSTLKAIELGHGLLLPPEEICWLKQRGIPTVRKALEQRPTADAVAIVEEDQDVNAIARSVWKKLQKIYPDQNMKEALEFTEKKKGGISDCYPFSRIQANALLEIDATLEKSDSKSQRFSVVPSKSDPTMTTYRLAVLLKEDAKLRPPVYELLDPLAKCVSPDEIVFRKGKASPFGWNLYGAKYKKDTLEMPNVVQATLILKSGWIADCFIKAFQDQFLQAHSHTEAKTNHRVIIVPLERALLETEEGKEQLVKSIEQIKSKLIENLGSFADQGS